MGSWGGRATFLKVMVHLTSSPAKTTWSCQCIKTRMLVLVLLLVWFEDKPSGDMVRLALGAQRGALAFEQMRCQILQ